MKVKDLIDAFEGTIPVKVHYLKNPDYDKLMNVDVYEGSLLGYISLIKDHGEEEVWHWCVTPGLKKHKDVYSSKLSKAELTIRLLPDIDD